MVKYCRCCEHKSLNSLLTIYNLFTSILGSITIHNFSEISQRDIYIRPSKYLKALRKNFQNSTHKSIPLSKKYRKPSAEEGFLLPQTHRRQFTLTRKMKSNFTKKRKIIIENKLYKCISAVACNKYSILTCRKARNIEIRNRIEHSQVHNSTVFS